jgi:hypothetical protein
MGKELGRKISSPVMESSESESSKMSVRVDEFMAKHAKKKKKKRPTHNRNSKRVMSNEIPADVDHRFCVCQRTKQTKSPPTLQLFIVLRVIPPTPLESSRSVVLRYNAKRSPAAFVDQAVVHHGCVWRNPVFLGAATGFVDSVCANAGYSSCICEFHVALRSIRRVDYAAHHRRGAYRVQLSDTISRLFLLSFPFTRSAIDAEASGDDAVLLS